MFEETFRNLDDTLSQDAGCSCVQDYIEQTRWALFLKYFDDFRTSMDCTFNRLMRDTGMLKSAGGRIRSL